MVHGSTLVLPSVWRVSSASGLLPQQFVLTLSAADAVWCMWRGQYADGYVPVGGSWFILKDQLPILVAAGLHSYALLVRHVLPWEWK